MRTLRLLSTAAAVMLIGGGVAMAQGTHEDRAKEPAARAPAALRHAPAEKMAPAIQHSQRNLHETTGQATHERLEPNRRANTQERLKPETTGQASPEHKNGNAEERHEKSEMKGGVHENGQANEHERNEHSERMGTGGKAENHRATTGQGAAAGAAKLSTEQRSKIVTIFHNHRVAPAHLNISVHVGARVPATVHFYPVPVQVIDIYPEWRGYDYILVGDEILIVDPATHEVVAILEA
jgi:Protein of unknown function (DUF1236)